MAQPSLSEGIRRLEADLGVALFERRGREVRLTHAGVGARSGEGDAARRRTRPPRGRPARRTAHRRARPGRAAEPRRPPGGATDRTVRVLAPSVSVRVATPASALELERMLLDGRCEVGITERSEGARGRGIDQLAFGTQELLAVFPPPQRMPAAPTRSGWRAGRAGHGVARRARGCALVLSPVGTSVRDHVDRALHSIGAAATVVVETNQRRRSCRSCSPAPARRCSPPRLPTSPLRAGDRAAVPTTDAARPGRRRRSGTSIARRSGICRDGGRRGAAG
ncbi:MAG: LysR family transcriptional regulator [Ilumatobacteraceae bacterium]